MCKPLNDPVFAYDKSESPEEEKLRFLMLEDREDRALYAEIRYYQDNEIIPTFCIAKSYMRRVA